MAAYRIAAVAAGLILAAAGSASAAPLNRYAYISNYNGGSVSVYDTQTRTVVDTLTGFNHPQAVAAKNDGSKVFIGIGTPAIMVRDTAANTTTTLASLPAAAATLVLNAGETKIYAIPNTTNAIYEVDVATGTVTTHSSACSSGSPFSGVLSPDGSQLYITCQGAHSVTAYDTATFGSSTSFSSGTTSPQGIGVSSDGTKLLIGDNNAGQAELITLVGANAGMGGASAAFSGANSVPQASGVAVLGNVGYVSAFSSAQVFKFDLSNFANAPTAFATGTNPQGMGVGGSGVLVIVNTGSASITTLSDAAGSMTTLDTPNIAVGTTPLNFGPYFFANYVAPVVPTTVPTLAEWAMIAFSGLLALAGVISVGRRRIRMA